MRLTLRARFPRTITAVLALFSLMTVIDARLSALVNVHGERRVEESRFVDPGLQGLAQNTNNCPEASTLQDKTGWELATGKYAARQDGETVTVTAAGENSTAGFQVQLARDPVKIFPPRFTLYRKPPEGFSAQVITRFAVCVAFKSRQPVSIVTVNDKTGAHRIKVEPAQ